MTRLRVPGVLAIGAVAVVSAIALSAQNPGTPAFEAASIKPNKSGDSGSMGIHTQGVEFTALNTTVRALLLQAFQIRQNEQLIGVLVARGSRPRTPPRKGRATDIRFETPRSLRARRWS